MEKILNTLKPQNSEIITQWNFAISRLGEATIKEIREAHHRIFISNSRHVKIEDLMRQALINSIKDQRSSKNKA